MKSTGIYHQMVRLQDGVFLVLIRMIFPHLPPPQKRTKHIVSDSGPECAQGRHRCTHTPRRDLAPNAWPDCAVFCNLWLGGEAGVGILAALSQRAGRGESRWGIPVGRSRLNRTQRPVPEQPTPLPLSGHEKT